MPTAAGGRPNDGMSVDRGDSTSSANDAPPNLIRTTGPSMGNDRC